jgi:hypothetical protein
MIQSEHMKSCLAAQIRFMLFKGPGSFKSFFKICGNLEYLKAYRLIPLTPPLRFHFTLPLKHCSGSGSGGFVINWPARSGSDLQFFIKIPTI